MEYEIKKGALSVRVDALGAELAAIEYAGAGYLWPGGSEWPRRAPVCCPWCGVVEGGEFSHGGRKYAAGRHGFVRDREHTLIERSAESLTLALEVLPDDPEWPWPFALTARFEAREAALSASYELINTGGEPMPLQLGFHPGFTAPEGSLVRAEKGDFPGGADTLAVTSGAFDTDSVNLSRPASKWFRLERPDGRSVTVDAEGYGWFLVWGAPGLSPFVCLEPWTGFPGPGGLFSRPGVVSLAPGERFKRTLNISLT